MLRENKHQTGCYSEYSWNQLTSGNMKWGFHLCTVTVPRIRRTSYTAFDVYLLSIHAGASWVWRLQARRRPLREIPKLVIDASTTIRAHVPSSDPAALGSCVVDSSTSAEPPPVSTAYWKACQMELGILDGLGTWLRM